MEIVYLGNWFTFYEARLGVEIFVELYDSMLSSSVSTYMLERYITSYFIAFTIVVYCCYGYLPISEHLIAICSIFLAYISYTFKFY